MKEVLCGFSAGWLQSETRESQSVPGDQGAQFVPREASGACDAGPGTRL